MPSPATTQSATSYTKSHSFSLGGSLTVGGSKKGDETTAKASLGVTANWSWNHSETRDINDTDIMNMSSGNYAQWKVIFNNLPYYSNGKIAYVITNSLSYRSTIDLYSSWMWYDPNGKDNSNKTPYSIKTTFASDYEMQSFITTGADNQTKKWDTNAQEKTYDLQSINNTTVGGIVLNNNLADDATLPLKKTDIITLNAASDFSITN